MPHISKFPLKKADEEKLIKALDSVLTKIENADQIDSFLISLLSPTERLMLAKRISTAVMLTAKIPDSQIASSLHITRVTVERMRYVLELKGDGYKIAFQILENEKLMDNLKTFLVTLAGYSMRAAGGRVKPSII